MSKKLSKMSKKPSNQQIEIKDNYPKEQKTKKQKNKAKEVIEEPIEDLEVPVENVVDLLVSTFNRIKAKVVYASLKNTSTSFKNFIPDVSIDVTYPDGVLCPEHLKKIYHIEKAMVLFCVTCQFYFYFDVFRAYQFYRMNQSNVSTQKEAKVIDDTLFILGFKLYGEIKIRFKNRLYNAYSFIRAFLLNPNLLTN